MEHALVSYELLDEAADAIDALEVRARPLETMVLDQLRAYVQSLQGHEPRDLYALLMPQLERPLLTVALEAARGNQQRAAQMLGIHRNTLRVRLKALSLQPSKGKP